MKYILALNKSLEVENFEKNRDNTTYIHVKNKKGEYITDQCTVKIILNDDGMLGLGKSLIRYAYEKEKVGGPLHFYKAQPNEAIIETLGIILVPESAEPIIGENIDKPIDEYLTNLKGSI